MYHFICYFEKKKKRTDNSEYCGWLEVLMPQNKCQSAVL